MKKKLFPVAFLMIFTVTGVFAHEHAQLMLRSTTSNKIYFAKINPGGYFEFPMVKPGTYTFSLIAPKAFFEVKTESAITLENLVWNTVGSKAARITNMTLPVITITSDMLAAAAPSDIKER